VREVQRQKALRQLVVQAVERGPQSQNQPYQQAQAQ